MASNVRFLDQVPVSAYSSTSAKSINTGSFMVTGSVDSSNKLTFTKGDGSTFDLQVAASASSADSLVTASVSGSTMTFTKGDGDTFDVALPSGGGSGIFKQVGSTDTFAATSSLQISGSTLLSSPLTETGSSVTASNAGTGGGVDKYALVTSESAWHYNTNVGVPTSEGWKTGLDGSYFNRFDQNTDTSEILRSAFQTIKPGVIEAGKSLGISIVLLVKL